ncbi:hypothetical protein BP6252_09095 [Coleophoma cylindrospora]|uniref:2EXR domain-containing protein n=1 Tax=Coleophoma cylindrospora TaxID=1849047 RepID=A0A3D8R0Y5_9HELO|nr:hypothetical protein BP6252_09095 [Coleophoma cylindrospora]
MRGRRGTRTVTQEPATREAATQESATQEAATQEAATQEAATQEVATQEAAAQGAATQAATPTTFHSFFKLPLELRITIWNLSIEPRYVKIKWSGKHRRCINSSTGNSIPALLHTCQESRTEALKTYALCFGRTPEFATVYFSYELDAAYIHWETFGAAPGRLGRKIGEVDFSRVRRLLIHEYSLMAHVEDRMRELTRFTGLKAMVVICEEESTGDQFGCNAVIEMAAVIDDAAEKLGGPVCSWPQLACLRSHDQENDPDDLTADYPGECSRHWWFEGWNQRAFVGGQKLEWAKTLGPILDVTYIEDEQSMMERLFLIAMLRRMERGEPLGDLADLF